jgi:D-cysteine desulfhydrase family pyridoxal phosphate-dependent enzyme
MDQSPLPRLHIAHLPTPVEPLPRLGALLEGPEVWIKRDDQTGLAFGGNKTRKLEYLVAEAQATGARTLMTCGAGQSNHCRQTAAAAARFGFQCILVLAGKAPQSLTGNALLDHLLGAEFIWAEDENLQTAMQHAFQEALAAGKQPYLIPYGGSNPVGAAAYATAMGEFLAQDVPVDVIVFATSSGGTQAGLLVGARQHGFQGRLLGISVDKTASYIAPRIATLASETAERLGLDLTFEPQDVEVNDQYLGEGYGVLTEMERSAIQLFARQEGILLDPVYTGKAAGGLLDLIRRGGFSPRQRILFWHTGGTPALFAYADGLA